jgi:DtxR family transcriptional regulator, Mn-dependent transcriptional regulator
MEMQKLTPAMEDYLKVIFVLEQENRVARVSDISRRMNVRKASVVSAVALLSKFEMLTHEKYGFITLTEKGRQDGGALKKKYAALYDLFVKDLKMPADKAALEACAAEHVLSADTVSKIRAIARAARKAALPEKQRNKGKKKR